MAKNGLKDQIFKATHREESATIMGHEVRVRGLSVGGRDVVQGAGLAGKPWRPRALIDCVLDPATSKPLFTAADEAKLAEMPAATFEPVIDVILRLSQITADEREELQGN